MFEERRQDKRYESHLKARIRILIPEETFTPFSHEGVILDMSRRGMKVKTWDIDEATYKMLLTSTRQVRITFNPPKSDEAHTLFGRIVWLDFNNLGRMPIMSYGIHFEQPSGDDEEIIGKCLKAFEEHKRETTDFK